MKRQTALHIGLTVLLTVGFALLGLFFAESYLRLFEAIRDLFGGIGYYFRALFGQPVIGPPHVAEYSNVVKRGGILPPDLEGFKCRAAVFFQTFTDRDHFLRWLSYAGKKAVLLAKISVLAIPVGYAAVWMVKRFYGDCNTDHGLDTLPLRICKKTVEKTLRPVCRFAAGYAAFLRTYPGIWIAWVVLFALHLNLAAIVLSFVGYCFYLAVSLDIRALYIQFVKLVLDLQVFLRVFPWWTLIPVALLLFGRFRRKIALARLRHFEARNCGFINELPIVSMTCGSMGKKKTTMITDMALSQEVMFRQKAFDILQKADMKFPYFPWIRFEDELLRCMEYGTVYNLATVKAWVRLKRARYGKHGRDDLQLYGYNSTRYGVNFKDGLKTHALFDVLETYAEAYFIYAIQTCLIVANYSVRTDNQELSLGNFPLWVTDFFTDKRFESRYAHILDFDVLRLGRKVLEDNPNAGSFEFGVVAITEIGKERGNNLELKEIRKKNDETNQKNDLFNSWLKMCRHSATVDHFPFIKVFTDEQRPESWGADARDLCDVVHIVSAGELRLTLPFYTLEAMISEWAFDRFAALYYDFRYRRGDNTLLVYLLKTVTALLWKRHVKICNRYGYSILGIEQERGTMDGKRVRKRYYLMSRKIYADRFTTDCFSDYFNDMARQSKVGLADYTEYATEKAGVEELKMQNSYFIRSLYKSNEEDSAT